MDFKFFLQELNSNFTLFIIFPAIVGIGLYLTFCLRFAQITQLGKSFRSLVQKQQGQGNISRFSALSAVLAGNFGTGNISGMAVAIATGGPGALVWMWVMAFFGAAIQYASCYLGVKYRRKNPDGEYVGGPMFYLEDGLGYKTIASLFALFTLFGSVTVGNFAQINSVILPLKTMGFNPFVCSLAIGAAVSVVILGGIRRIAHFASYIVPLKALLYLGAAFLILFFHADQILPSLKLMFNAAFGCQSAIGGLFGAGMAKAITTGFDRGLFATDAGTGIVPILQAGARSNDPVLDGIATLAAPLMVMIVCTVTGLVLLVTGAWQVEGLQSTNMVIHAFKTGLDSPIGSTIVLAALILFAFTTILAWAYCGEKALGYLIGPEKGHVFRVVYVLLIPVGAIIHVGIIWTLADLAITCMVVANLIGVMGLSRDVIRSSRDATRA